MLPSKSKSRDAVNIDLVNNAFFVKCIKVLADNHTYSNPWVYVVLKEIIGLLLFDLAAKGTARVFYKGCQLLKRNEVLELHA